MLLLWYAHGFIVFSIIQIRISRCFKASAPRGPHGVNIVNAPGYVRQAITHSIGGLAAVIIVLTYILVSHFLRGANLDLAFELLKHLRRSRRCQTEITDKLVAYSEDPEVRILQECQLLLLLLLLYLVLTVETKKIFRGILEFGSFH